MSNELLETCPQQKPGLGTPPRNRVYVPNPETGFLLETRFLNQCQSETLLETRFLDQCRGLVPPPETGFLRTPMYPRV